MKVHANDVLKYMHSEDDWGVLYLVAGHESFKCQVGKSVRKVFKNQKKKKTTRRMAKNK